MENKKQNSIDWLFDNLNLCFDKFDNGEYSYTEFVNASKEIKKQAKAMHKDEIVEAVDFSNKKWTSMKIEVILNGQQYYNETFKGQDNE